MCFSHGFCHYLGMRHASISCSLGRLRKRKKRGKKRREGEELKVAKKSREESMSSLGQVDPINALLKPKTF